MLSFNSSVFFSLSEQFLYTSKCYSYSLAHLNSSVPELLQCWSYICLKLVFHTSQTEKLHLPFQALYHCSNFQGSVMDAQLCLVVAVLYQPEVKAEMRILKGGKNTETTNEIMWGIEGKHGPRVDKESFPPQSPDIAPLTETSWPPQVSSDLLLPCFHTWTGRKKRSE